MAPSILTLQIASTLAMVGVIWFQVITNPA